MDGAGFDCDRRGHLLDMRGVHRQRPPNQCRRPFNLLHSSCLPPRQVVQRHQFRHAKGLTLCLNGLAMFPLHLPRAQTSPRAIVPRRRGPKCRRAKKRWPGRPRRLEDWEESVRLLRDALSQRQRRLIARPRLSPNLEHLASRRQRWPLRQ